MSSFLQGRTKALKIQFAETIKSLEAFAHDIGHEALSKTVAEVSLRMNEPFMFVVVGEVKAGKSSFINALLGADREICKVAPQPMTDTIQQIVYGQNEASFQVNPFLKRVELPIEVLREVAIVDTPGTNSIVEHHQEVTERFVPVSDLVIFVFEARNPYRQSAWTFFDFIHRDWHKKTIFVLQQKDVLNEQELTVNTQGLRSFATNKGLDSPPVFAVSARRELEGRFDESGFSAMRDFIRSKITGGRGAALKLANTVQTALEIVDRIARDLKERALQHQNDATLESDLVQALNEEEGRAKRHINVWLENLLNGYDNATRETERELSVGLSFPHMLMRSVTGLFRKQTSLVEWLAVTEKRFETTVSQRLEAKVTEGFFELADSIQQMATMVDLRIRNANTERVRSDAYLFDDIAQRRAAVLGQLKESFAQFLRNPDSFRDETFSGQKMTVSPHIATSSGAAVVGMVLAFATKAAIFDVTGGVITAVSALFAGVTAGVQRRRLLKAFQEEAAKGRQKLALAVESQMNGYVSGVRRRIESHFVQLRAHLATEKKALAALNQREATLRAQCLDVQQQCQQFEL